MPLTSCAASCPSCRAASCPSCRVLPHAPHAVLPHAPHSVCCLMPLMPCVLLPCRCPSRCSPYLDGYGPASRATARGSRPSLCSIHTPPSGRRTNQHFHPLCCGRLTECMHPPWLALGCSRTGSAGRSAQPARHLSTQGRALRVFRDSGQAEAVEGPTLGCSGTG